MDVLRTVLWMILVVGLLTGLKTSGQILEELEDEKGRD